MFSPKGDSFTEDNTICFSSEDVTSAKDFFSAPGDLDAPCSSDTQNTSPPIDARPPEPGRSEYFSTPDSLDTPASPEDHTKTPSGNLGAVPRNSAFPSAPEPFDGPITKHNSTAIEATKNCTEEISESRHAVLPKKFRWKGWMTATVCCTALLLIVLFIPWKNFFVPDISSPDSSVSPPHDLPSNTNTPPLSDSCEYILCRGVDAAGNTYELVANQTESARGFEIVVGVIKNNVWIYPLSASFPFLADDNLFHVSVSMDGHSGTSLENPNSVIDNIYFIDSGAFLMDSYKATSSWLDSDDHTKIIFNCDSLRSYIIDCEEISTIYHSSSAVFDNGKVISYGQIYTEDGKFVLYEETSGTISGWAEDRVYDWSLFDVETLTATTFSHSVPGIYPESILSEGLIFASDKCFYDTKFNKVIDLSDYNIDMWYDSNIFFTNGTCTFKAKNKLGTEFLVTIDKSGNVLNEAEQ